MRKGTIFKNNWAGHETYFVYQSDKRINGQQCCHGWDIVKIDGVWRLRQGDFYRRDLETDSEHFPVVGYINLHVAIRQLIMDAVGVKDGREESE